MTKETTTVLLLEDEPTQRRLMRRLLVHTGFEVIDVASVEEGVDAFLLYQPDLVVSDFELGDGTATEFFEGSGCDSSRCIVVTGHPSPPLPKGMNFLNKPVDFERFFALIDEALEQPVLEGAASVSWAECDDQPVTPAIDMAPQFVLYVTPGAPSSDSARRRISALLTSHELGDVQVAVCELPDGEAAPVGPDHVVFTPALVRVRPGPRTWIVGDRGDDAFLRDFLGLRSDARCAHAPGIPLALDAG